MNPETLTRLLAAEHVVDAARELMLQSRLDLDGGQYIRAWDALQRSVDEFDRRTGKVLR